MEKGDLCKVVTNNHTDWQLGDLVFIIKVLGSSYVEGRNIRTGNRHHYLKENLEKL